MQAFAARGVGTRMEPPFSDFGYFYYISFPTKIVLRRNHGDLGSSQQPTRLCGAGEMRVTALVGCDQGPANCPSVLKRAFCSLPSVA
jgi:hypothetical protein